MNEIWKPIKGYEGLYDVSDKGSVRSLPRKNRLHPKILRQHPSKKGYMRVALYKSGKMKHYYVHRLVADAFIPNPHNLPFINHKDEVKTNNFVDNLEWCTMEYNNEYGTGQQRGIQMAIEKQAKKVAQYSLDGNFIREWESLSQIQRELGYKMASISRCCKGKCKKNKSYNFFWMFS